MHSYVRQRVIEQRETQMTIYINTAWTARDYEATNVRFQITDELPRNMSGTVNLENWKPLDTEAQEDAKLFAELGCDYLAQTYKVEQLGGFAGHTFYGHP